MQKKEKTTNHQQNPTAMKTHNIPFQIIIKKPKHKTNKNPRALQKIDLSIYKAEPKPEKVLYRDM